MLNFGGVVREVVFEATCLGPMATSLGSILSEEPAPLRNIGTFKPSASVFFTFTDRSTYLIFAFWEEVILKYLKKKTHIHPNMFFMQKRNCNGKFDMGAKANGGEHLRSTGGTRANTFKNKPSPKPTPSKNQNII